MGAIDGFYNRNTGFLALKYSKVSLTARLHYLVEGSPKVRVSPKTVAERLGHASVVITLDLYSHCLPGVQEAAAAQFDAAMESAKLTAAEGSAVILR